MAFFPGDGIGPEIANSVIDIFAAAKVPIEWEFHAIHKKAMTEKGDLITEESLKAVRDYKFSLKGVIYIIIDQDLLKRLLVKDTDLLM